MYTKYSNINIWNKFIIKTVSAIEKLKTEIEENRENIFWLQKQ